MGKVNMLSRATEQGILPSNRQREGSREVERFPLES
jgi:hypothetical protein